MQGDKFEEILSREQAFLTKKAPHTKYKIQYVSEYAKTWAYIASEFTSDNINFIDCMCNAGIYRDGDFCSAIEVLKSFRDCAYRYPHKKYNLFLNDYDVDKVRIIKEVCNTIYSSYPSNLHIIFDNEDVNTYLYNIKKMHGAVFTFLSMTILYVDPYSFHTVKIRAIEDFVKTTYCELLFNLFTSDFNRNKIDLGIREVLGGDYQISNVDELVEHVVNRLKVGKMKHFLSYPFRQQKNVELYQILFATPNDKGLDKLKDALWKVFDGCEYYRTDLAKEHGQLSLFSETENQEISAKKYANECILSFVEAFNGKEIAYSTIERYVLERSLLKSSHIIKYIIKPMLADGKLIKNNLAGKSNYKSDSYWVKG